MSLPPDDEKLSVALKIVYLLTGFCGALPLLFGWMPRLAVSIPVLLIALFFLGRRVRRVRETMFMTLIGVLIVEVARYIFVLNTLVR